MLSLLMAGVVVGIIVSGRAIDRPDIIAREPSAEVRAEPGQAVAAAPANGPDFTRVAAQTVRAVTNISSVQVVRRSASPFTG